MLPQESALPDNDRKIFSVLCCISQLLNRGAKCLQHHIVFHLYPMLFCPITSRGNALGLNNHLQSHQKGRTGCVLPLGDTQNMEDFMLHSLQQIMLQVYLWFVCQFAGIWLTLNGLNYINNSVVTIIEIGNNSAALLCSTILPGCCFSGANGWFLPNGNGVMRAESLPYYRTRAQYPGIILLHRNPEGTTTGIFRCDIPDGNNVLQSLYVGIYTNTTGESCTLSEQLIIYKVISST